jgi:tRNA(Ile)-lysidine synthase
VLAELRARLVGLDGVSPTVVVACSGGADSLALLALADAAELGPIAVHVDHGLRHGSADEAAVVAAHASRLGVLFRSERVDVEAGSNVEARARTVRYAALEHARSATGSTVVLVGHTADDQAETVLLNLLRGSGTTGLGGMPVARDTLVRPMLELRRADTERLCAELGFEPLHAPSNDDLTLRRNWIRHEVLPLLSEGSGRDLVPVLARQARLLRDDADYLDSLAAAVVADGPATRVLAAMPLPLARRAIRLWLGPPPPSADEVERVLAVARGEVRAAQLPGPRRVQRDAGRLVVLERR